MRAGSASWLGSHPAVERVYFPADPNHPDAATIRRMFPPNLFGAIVSFELKDRAEQQQVFAFHGSPEAGRARDLTRRCAFAYSLPAMASHRDVGLKQRLRMGIRDNLVRISVGIENIDDIIADFDQALKG